MQSGFFERIRERKLIRWAVAYLAGAWVLLQVFDLLAESFAWPAGVMRGATVFLAIAFLAVLVVAWYHGELGHQRVRAGEVGAVAVLLAVAAGAAVVVARAAPDAESPAIATAPAEQNSIAVLPFVNLSDSRDNEYFSDGITEEILHALAQVRGLRVASRTSAFQFKNQTADVSEIARKLRVANVLEGSVRQAGDRLRITAQLIDASNGYHLWSETFDRELKDVFAVQTEIARAIVEALRVELAPATAARLADRGTEDVEAYTLFLRGNAALGAYAEPELRQAIELFEAALRRDPDFARAHAGLASAWFLLADDWLPPHDAYVEGLRHAERAVALDSLDADALEALASVRLAYQWDLRESERLLLHAAALSPNNANTQGSLGLVNEFAERLPAAEAYYQRAAYLDPLASLPLSYLARLYLHQRNWQKTLDTTERVLALVPRHLVALRTRGDVHLARGEPARALETFQQGLAYDGDFTRLRSGEVRALAALGRRDEATAKLRRLEAEREERYVRAEEIAQGWAALGDRDRAFEWLDTAYRERSAGMLFLNAWPAYDPLREDPRFAELLRKVGLPAPRTTASR